MSDASTILFAPESAYGPTNNCIGIGDVLRRRGHRVVFAAESSWRGRLEALGFEEHLVDLAPPSTDTPGDAGQFWRDFIAESAPAFRRPAIEQLQSFMVPTWQALIDGAVYSEPRLADIVASVSPDVIVEDNVVCFPALMTARAPFVRMMSCNPLEMPGAGVPPPYSGLATGDSAGWQEFRAEYRRTHASMWSAFNDWVQQKGAPPLADLQFIHESTALNLYVYPEEIDYSDRRPLGAAWHRLDSSVRRTDGAAFIPEAFVSRPAGTALVYVSMGSLGSADVELMRRLIDALAPTRHRYVVSLGPRAAELDLAENMWGAEFLPQTRILSEVDLVITHGGNNTVTECLHFGKPAVALPIFWDQHDNAQRLDETAFGVRVDTYGCEPAELRDAVERALSDGALRRRTSAAGEVIRARDGLTLAADLIERAAR